MVHFLTLANASWIHRVLRPDSPLRVTVVVRCADRAVRSHGRGATHSNRQALCVRGHACLCGPAHRRVVADMATNHVRRYRVLHACRYMENQYFISSTPDNGVKNGVVEALLGRIRQAIEHGCVGLLARWYRRTPHAVCWVCTTTGSDSGPSLCCLPTPKAITTPIEACRCVLLFASFRCTLHSPPRCWCHVAPRSGRAAQPILHHQPWREFIARQVELAVPACGHVRVSLEPTHSWLHAVMANKVTLAFHTPRYISFYSLRTEGRLANGLRVTEQVYVHSKLLIVDDCVAVIGSANVNDRSLLGDRDSEVMAVVVDKQVVPSRMGGDHWNARGFAVSLRHRLWRQHLGLMEPDAPEVDITDPIAPET